MSTESKVNINAKWYIVQVVSNYETKVKEFLENRDFQEGETGITEIYLPMKIVETKTGRLKKKAMFPGYLYVKVDMTDDSWYIIRNTEYVTGIVGSSGQRTKPTPISELDVRKIKQREKEELELMENIQTTSNSEDIKIEINVNEGDYVEIKDGEFAGKVVKVLSVSLAKQSVEAEVEMFGRMVPVEISFTNFEKKQ